MTAYPAPADATARRQRQRPFLPVVVDEGEPRPFRRPVSAIVTTYNEADSIDECLESLAWCDEILVVDSHSTDGTREIAGRHQGVRILSRDYFGAASQKNWAIDRCRHDWTCSWRSSETTAFRLKRRS